MGIESALQVSRGNRHLLMKEYRVKIIFSEVLFLSKLARHYLSTKLFFFSNFPALIFPKPP